MTLEADTQAHERLMALAIGMGEIQLVAMPQGRTLIRLKPPQDPLVAWIKLKEDGSRLWLLGEGHRVYEWDLDALRRELALLGLDWAD